jgi:hypothetical protein
MINEFVIKGYLNAGLNVIPVNQDKTPACDWKHWQSNKMDNFGLFTTDCIAIICGKISDNLMVLDFDNHQKTAKANLAKYIESPLIKEIYSKYKLPVIKTQSGGYHLYFRCNELSGNEKLAQIKVNNKLDVIIEVRGEGGYILAPPTKGYELIRNQIVDLQFIEDHEKIILFEVAKSFNQATNRTFKPKTDDQTPWNIYDAKPESINEAKQILLNYGWTDIGFNNSWCRPGKNKGISATFGNVADNVFYVFTSSTEFDNQHGYKPSAIKAILEFKGDFSACAKALAKEYGLSRAQEPIKEIPKINYQDSLIDFNKEYVLPTVIIKIKEGIKWLDICSLGNFSCFTGKSKARKSFASHFFMAGAISNKSIQEKFGIFMPENKRNVIYFDTEQSTPHVARATYGIVKMSQISNLENFQAYALRKYTYKDRCSIIEEILSRNLNTGIAFIDGIADLAFGNNDEEEANRVTQLLMTWTSSFDLHINTVIHQTKANDWATGHLGSSIEKKAESVISIRKDRQYSFFEPRQLRNCEDFTEFPFWINSMRLPELVTDADILENLTETEI